MIIDAHCHLQFSDFDADREAVIERAQAAGVNGFICVGADEKTNEGAYALSLKYPFIYNTVGLHPHYCHALPDADIEKLIAGSVAKSPVAIGEVGLDYYKSRAPKEKQVAVFCRMLDLALSLKLPAVVHSRQSSEDTIGILQRYARRGLKAVMHCFSYDTATLEKILSLGFFVSFTCMVTYKKAEALVQALELAPLERLMVETDAPYLPPQNLRGKRNEPAMLLQLIDFISKIKGIDPVRIKEQTSRNVLNFFGLPLGEGQVLS